MNKTILDQFIWDNTEEILGLMMERSREGDGACLRSLFQYVVDRLLKSTEKMDKEEEKETIERIVERIYGVTSVSKAVG